MRRVSARNGRLLKVAHLVCVALWVGSVATCNESVASGLFNRTAMALDSDVWHERHLRRLLRVYAADYYHKFRTHLSPTKTRQNRAPSSLPRLRTWSSFRCWAWLHHRYTRRAA